jgi:hypothetical protein
MITKKISFDGGGALEITTARLRMVVTTEFGPRIAFLGRPGGQNLFYWHVDKVNREGWRLLGGHRVWITRPMADESEDAYAADNGPCEFEEAGGLLSVTGAAHPFLKTRRGVRIRALDENAFEVTSFVTNVGPMLYSGGVWCLTCIQPRAGMTFGIPLGDRHLDWDVVKLVFARAWAGHTSRVEDPQIRFNEEFMIVEPQGVETKRMLWAPLGALAMTWPAERLSFVKRTQSDPNAQYPLGCNLAIYVAPDNTMVEMETCGAERTLRPGETAVNVETWRVSDEVFDWSDAAPVVHGTS